MSKITKPWKIAEKNRKKGQNRSSSRQSHPFLAQDPDAVVGQFHDLPVENFSDYGVYLSFGRDRVLLPNKYVPEDLAEGARSGSSSTQIPRTGPLPQPWRRPGWWGILWLSKSRTLQLSVFSWTGDWKKTF